MKLENLEELLTMDTDGNKADENKKLLRSIKQLLKKEVKVESSLENKAKDLPYEAVSVVGNKLVTLKFDLESKEAVVEKTEVDGRDTGTKNYMAAYAATNAIKHIARRQKEMK